MRPSSVPTIVESFPRRCVQAFSVRKPESSISDSPLFHREESGQGPKPPGSDNLLSRLAPLLALFQLGCSLHLGPFYSPESYAPTEAQQDLFSSISPEELFRDAVNRRVQGDPEGAISRLLALRLSGDTSAPVLYQLGVAYEALEEFETALSVYDLLLSESRDPGVDRDAGFRRAQVLEVLARYPDSLRQLQRIQPPAEGFSFEDRQTYDIQLGAALALNGRDRRGEELIRGGLSALSGTGETFIQAKGRYVLLSRSLSEVEELSMEGSDKKIQRNLERRGGAILEAERELIDQIIPLKEPQWILAGCLSVGDAYAELAADIGGAAPPAHLTDDQAAIYQQMVQERATVLLQKAWSRYDSGLTYADQMGIANRYTRWLAERRSQVESGTAGR